MNLKVASEGLRLIANFPSFFLIRSYCILFSTASSSHASGIKITDIFVPNPRLVGDDAELECRFEKPNGVRLYSIKWWRDNDQFYQYIQRNDPPKLPFNVSGIKVDTARSSEVRVFLSHVTVDTSGAFTCEVMADGSFETIRSSKNMTVIDPPDGSVEGTYGPFIKITGVDGVAPGPIDIHVGKTLEALCISRKAFPAASLTWFINGREAADDFLTHTTPHQENRNSFTSQLWLTFTLTEGLFDQTGKLILVCNATQGPLYHRHATVAIQNPVMRRRLTYGLFSSGAPVAISAWLLCITILSLIVPQIDDCSIKNISANVAQ